VDLGDLGDLAVRVAPAGLVVVVVLAVDLAGLPGVDLEGLQGADLPAVAAVGADLADSIRPRCRRRATTIH